MKLTKCVNGHFYDEEKFESCPHCAGGSKLDVNAIFGGAPSAPKPAMSKIERDDDMTVPLEWTPTETPQDLETDQTVSEDSVVTGEPEPFVMPDVGATGETESFESLDNEVTGEPEPFELAGFETVKQPEPFVSTEIEETTEQQSLASAEPNPSVGIPAAWEIPQPSVEEIPVGDYREMPDMADPALEDQPTEIVDGGELDPFVTPDEPGEVAPSPFVATESAEEPSVKTPDPFVAAEPVNIPGVEAPDPFVAAEPVNMPGVETPGPFVTPEPAAELGTPGPFVPEFGVPETAPTAEAPSPTAPSPAAAMFGASTDDDDDEHTVAFYDEIFVSKAPSAPVVPQAIETTPVAPEATPVADIASPVGTPVSEPVVESAGKEDRVAEPDVFTAPPLQPAQALPTPCVGWLIALNGSHIGQDFHLRVGKNYIGRDTGMDIALTGDKSVSRNKHAIVVYEPKHHKYFIQPGESNELVYVNDEVVLLPMPLKPYDLIVIGDIELWFMPLCDDQHNWSEVIRKLQEQMNPNVH